MQIILQHIVIAVVVTDKINTRDMGVDAAVEFDALHAGLVLLVGQHLLGRNDAGLEDMLFMIDIVQEGIEGRDPLADPLIQHLPLTSRNDAGHIIKRDQALGAFLIAIDIEGDTYAVKQQIGFFALLLDLLGICLVQPLPERGVMATATPVAMQHFIVEVGCRGVDLKHQ